MNIGAVTEGHGHVKPFIHRTKDSASVAISDGRHTTAATAESNQTSTADPQKGVIRNLLAGHFKGVADVRLRINFHEEIAAIEGAARAASIEGQSETFLNIARDGLDLIPSEAPLPETYGTAAADILADYEASVQTTFAEFEAEPTETTERLSGSLRMAFDTFVVALEKALTGPVPTEGNENDSIGARPAGVAAAEIASLRPDAETALELSPPSSDAETEFDLEQFIADMTAAFEAALAELELSLQAATVLPELSEPRGNGVAYEKFLTVYQAMRGEPAAEAAPPSQVDAEA
jgi:hypothetical protein